MQYPTRQHRDLVEPNLHVNKTHNHDDRYYTEAEADSRYVPSALAGILQSAADVRYGYKNFLTVGPTGSTADYVCDGTADHTEIQAALNTRKPVLLLPGTYTVSGIITLKSGAVLIGSGESSVIKLANAGNLTTMFRNEHWTAGTIADSGFLIAALTFDGNGANQTNSGTNYKTNGFIFKSCANVTFRDCLFREINGFALNADRVSFGDSPSYPQNFRVYNCTFTKSSDTKFFWDVVAIGVNGGEFIGNRIVTTVTTNNALTSPYFKDFKIAHNHFDAPLRAVSIETVNDLMSTGNSVIDNICITGSNAIYLGRTSDLRVSDNDVRNTSGYGISLTSTCTDIQVEGNRFQSGQFWINCNGSSSKITVSGNHFAFDVAASDGIVVREDCTDISILGNILDGTNGQKVIALLDGVTGIHIIGNTITASNYAAVFLGSTSGDEITRATIAGNDFRDANFGVVYGPGTLIDSIVSANTFETWEKTSPGSYGAVKAVLKHCVIAGNRMKNTGAGRGIVEDTGSTTNTIVDNNIDGVTTAVVLQAASASTTNTPTYSTDVEITDLTKGVILTSPDGTRYRVKAANGGTLTVTAA